MTYLENNWAMTSVVAEAEDLIEQAKELVDLIYRKAND
jgi:hypothetical protein